MKNVFFVKSPLQLLNAIEAKHDFNLGHDDCVLVVVGDKKSYPQMINLVAHYGGWGNIIYLDSVPFFFAEKHISKNNNYKNNNNLSISASSTFFRVRKLNKIAKHFSEIDMLFIGDNYNPLMRHLINSTNHNRVVLLDDGVGAIYMAKIRSNISHFVPEIKFKKRIKLAAKRLFQGLDDSQADSVCFFSAYDLDLPENDSIIKNKYNYLRKECQHIEQSDAVYFLGSPLYEGGLMDKEQYISQVRLVANYFNDREFVYVAHRREGKEKLAQIKDELNVEIRLFDYPIEYQLTMIGPRPSVLASFVSSALENVRLIMGDQLKVVSFRLKEGTYGNQDQVDSIYSYYEENLNDYFQIKLLDE